MLNKISFGTLFMIFGIVIQIFAFYYTNASVLSLISGVAGIFSVVLCAERKMSFWVFAWIQLITYLILAYNQKLWGEVSENIFYAITMIIGMFIWYKYKEESTVKSRKLSNKLLIGLTFITILGIIALYSYLSLTNDTQPFVDSVSTVPAIIGELLMIAAFREQWYFWLTIDVASIYMWGVAGDWCMVAQFVFWTINCLYGIKNWNYEAN